MCCGGGKTGDAKRYNQDMTNNRSPSFLYLFVQSCKWMHVSCPRRRGRRRYFDMSMKKCIVLGEIFDLREPSAKMAIDGDGCGFGQAQQLLCIRVSEG